MTTDRTIKMKPPLLLLLLWSSVVFSQRPGDDRPFRFQSFPSNPPQSFQQINFFNPLSPQQQSSTPNRQALFFASQNGGQSSNPFVNSAIPLSSLTVQRPQQNNFNPQRQNSPDIATNNFQSGGSKLTPASTAFRPDLGTRQSPLFEFKFSQDQVQPIEQFNRVQQPALPVPIVFRTPKPVDVPARPPVQETASIPPAILEDSTIFQRVRPLTPSPIRSESPLNIDPPTTPKPAQLQVLGDQPEDVRDNRQLRNRLRRPNTEPSVAEQNIPRRVPPVREGNPNLEPVVVDDAPPPNRLRFRSSTTQAPSTAVPELIEGEEPVTSRIRTPFLRPRPTTKPRTIVRIPSTEPRPEEEPTTNKTPSTIRFFGGRRTRPTVAPEPEVTTTRLNFSRFRGRITPVPSEEPSTTSPVQDSPPVDVNNLQDSVQEVVVEQQQEAVIPDVGVEEFTDITLLDDGGELGPDEFYVEVDEVVDENDPSLTNESPTTTTTTTTTTTETIPVLPSASPTLPATTSAAPLQELPPAEPVETPVEIPETPVVDEILETPVADEILETPVTDEILETTVADQVPETVNQVVNVEENVNQTVNEPIISQEPDVVEAPPVADLPIAESPVADLPIAETPVEEEAIVELVDVIPVGDGVEGPATDGESIVPEEETSKTPQPTGGNRPAKFKIFNLGRRNTSSVNLDNVVFVPNLDGLVLPQPVTPNTMSVETSRSVTVVKVSSEQATTQTTPAVSSDRQSKAIDSKTDLLANNNQADGKQPPVKEIESAVVVDGSEPTEAAESSVDELDRIQSALFNKHLNNNFNIEADKLANITTTTTPTPSTSRPPFRPSFERPRRPFDSLPSQPESPTTVDPTTPQVGEQPPVVATSEIPAEASSSTTSSTSAESTTTKSLFERLLGSKVALMDTMTGLLPPGFVSPKEPEIPVGPPETTQVPAVQETSPTSPKVVEIKMDDVSAFLPPGFKLEEPPVTESSTTRPSLLDKIPVPVKMDDVSAFLPPGFKLEEPPITELPTTTTTTTTKTGLDGLFDSANLEDLGGLLPPGFKQHLFTPSPSKTRTTTLATIEVTTSLANVSTTTTSKKGLVFPTRASPARTTTSEKPRVKPTHAAIEIKSGWPIRATTEFTGWPSPPTTPFSPTPSTSTTARTTTTRTTTTTTTTPRVTTVGQCGEECRLAGTVRLVEGIEWMPELSDHNTREWYQLAAIVEQSLDSVYQSGPLAPWYAGIVVEAFSRGSVLVDYYLNLNGTTILDTGEIRNYFHMSLEKEGDNYKLGNFTVDTKSTDFIVLRQPVSSDEKQRVVTGGVGEWVIAVIVVGLASLIFVIAFGTTMLIRRRRQHQRKPLPLTEEMLNELNKNHMSGVENTGSESFYNDEVGDAWEHRTNFPTKPIKPLPRPASVSAIRTHGSGGSTGYNYNHYTNYNNFRPQLHDTWKSEWDSSYYDSNSSTTQRSKTAPRPATSYGRYPTYGRSRPTYHDDF